MSATRLTDSDMQEYLKALPKAELHLHIEGSLEPELMFELAGKNNIDFPYKSVEEVRKAYNFHNLQSFLDIYYAGASVLINESDFYDMTFAYMKRAHEDGIRHTEIFFDPQTHTDRGIAFDTVIKGIDRALLDAKDRFGITSKVILCFLRHLSEEAAMETFESSLPYKHKIIGVGLDSSELGHPPEKFSRVFARAREEGFLPVAHAGEEGPPEYIWQAINDLKVKRIDHGVRCLEDDELAKHLGKEQVPLTVCPLSNIKLCVFPTLEDHNLKELLDAGICAMINSDDPAYFGGYLLENFVQCQKALDLTVEEIEKLAINSFRASFLEEEAKARHINDIVTLSAKYRAAAD